MWGMKISIKSQPQNPHTTNLPHQTKIFMNRHLPTQRKQQTEFLLLLPPVKLCNDISSYLPYHKDWIAPWDCCKMKFLVWRRSWSRKVSETAGWKLNDVVKYEYKLRCFRKLMQRCSHVLLSIWLSDKLVSSYWNCSKLQSPRKILCFDSRALITARSCLSMLIVNYANMLMHSMVQSKK